MLVAGMDTKGQEALYIADCLKNEGIFFCLLDAGIKGRSPVPVDGTSKEVAAAAGTTMAEAQSIKPVPV